MPNARTSRPPRMAATAILIALSLICYAAYHVRTALMPFALSFALAYLLNPLIHLFEARGLRRDPLVIALYALIAAGIAISVNIFLPTVVRELSLLQAQAPAYLTRARDIAGHLQTQLARHLPVGRGAVEHWGLQMVRPLMEHAQLLPGYLLGLFPLLSLLFLVPFISFFLLMDAGRIIAGAIQACPSRYVEQALHLLTEINTSLGNYGRGVLIEAVAVGAAAFLGLWALGVNYAVAIACVSGAFNLVPYAGAVLGATLAGLVALFQFRSAWGVAQVLMLFGAVRIADDVLLQPLISRHSVHLHPMVYLLALLVGGETFGFAGLLFAIPAACILKALIQVLWTWYASETLALPDELPPAARLPYV